MFSFSFTDSDVAAMCNTCIQSRPKACPTEFLLETFSPLIVETFSDSPPGLAVCSVPHYVRLSSALIHHHSPLPGLAALSVRLRFCYDMTSLDVSGFNGL